MDKLGGVCLNRGCIPSKALIASAGQYRKMKEAAGFGINLSSPPAYDWPAMRARKDKIVDSLVRGIGQLFKSHGVVHYSGFGKISGVNQVTVTDENGNETVEVVHEACLEGGQYTTQDQHDACKSDFYHQV